MLSRRIRASAAAMLMLAAFLFTVTQALAQQRTARVGVLAYRGVEETRTRWQPLIAYLNDRVTGWRFELVPLTLLSAPEKLRSRQIEFIATNPGHYVTLAERFNLSALATRERRAAGGERGTLYFGTVIFARAERTDLETLADLKGKTMLAVSPDAFGGFQMAWLEMTQQGVDPFTDLARLRFMGFPQDAIVEAVKAGAADAGIVRSGLLEAMAREGRIELKDFRVLQNNSQLDRPFMVSSRLYPEWAFAVVHGADRQLTEQVTLALLQTQEEGTAARYGLIDLWSAPLSYEGVRTMIAAYTSSARARSGRVDSLAESLSRIIPGWASALLVLGAAAIGFAGGLFAMRRKLRQPAVIAPQTRDEGDISMRARFDDLTRREQEVLSLICRGHPTKVIAERLHISPKTVEFHRANLLHKTHARSTPMMVRMATRYGFDQRLSPGGS